jgi:hypothetical protein
MAGDALSQDALIESYLAEVARRLPAGRRRRAAILDELRDGLYEAVDRGLAPAEAARDFGAPPTVAAAFAGELATVRARRTAWAYLGTGPLVGVWWLFTFVPHPWATGPGAVWAAIPLLPLVGLAVLTAVTMLVVTGRATRWVPAASPHQAITAAAGIAIACVSCDLSALSALGTRFLTDQPLPWLVATVAVAASVVRISATAPTVGRLLDTRAALA